MLVGDFGLLVLLDGEVEAGERVRLALVLALDLEEVCGDLLHVLSEISFLLPSELTLSHSSSVSET